MAKAVEEEAEKSDHRPEDDVEMTFFEHLGELRNRLVRALIGLLPGLIVGWIYKRELLELLTLPFVQAWNQLHLAGQPHLAFANPVDPLVAYLLIASIAGLIVASPWVFYQAWAFIAPGLYRRERRLAVPFMVTSTLFFVGGVVFCYALVLEPAFVTFLEYSADLPELRITPQIMIMDYLEFATRLLVAFGATFEVPVVISFLAFAGIVNWRQLIKFARWWLLISAIVAAVLTPPDVGSQMIMLIPLNILYWFSILLAAIFGPKAPKPEKPKVVAEDDEEEEES